MTTLRLGRLDVHILAGAPTRVSLAGRIDDGAAIGDLLAKLPPGDILIDTAGVTFVNSVGMREWTRLVRALHGRGDHVRLERVADVLMTQMNLVGELKQAVTIVSFKAQYVCPHCGAEDTPLVDAIANAELLKSLAVPQPPCLECGTPMALGDFPERYLSIFQP